MADEKKSPELVAIEKVAEQAEGFSKKLGEHDTAIKGINQGITDLKEGYLEMSKEEFDNAIETVNGGINDQVEKLDEMAEDIAQMKENGNHNGFGKALLTEENMKAFVETLEKGEKAMLEMKSAEVFGSAATFATGSQVDAFTGREVDPELYQRMRKSNLILDSFQISPISVQKLIYLQKEEDSAGAPVLGDGGGAWILPGAPKPQRSFRLTTGEVVAKKVAIFANAEDKILRDVASLNTWIREDLSDEMLERINDGLLNNDPGVNADAPLGLKTNSTLYVATPGYATSITNSNTIEQIIAAIARMRFLKEQAAVVYVASDVYYKIHHLKDSQERFQNRNLVYVNTLGQLFIAGVPVLATDEEDVPSTNILVIGAQNGFKIRSYGNMVLEAGMNGEDFREDKTSFRGYQEFLSYIPSQRENSVLYDTFANIALAIDTP